MDLIWIPAFEVVS